ncbi:hypothetical protein [Sphingosinicella sp. BN140058]|uniref:hypothetical protein n=1 Tax=Sphingosinicella sp. BN140058 TaxID=1892855 RepID=UPI001013198B|nr:hypothetical protein [Sphingosinicella sp. BN140058]QAY78690.1 hypothetical protein ETR14_20710 [Sphingosinicella sp. BN140058]
MNDTPSQAAAIANPLQRQIAEALDSAYIDYACEPGTGDAPHLRLANGVRIALAPATAGSGDEESATPSAATLAVHGEAAATFLAGLIARQAKLEEIIAEAYQVVGSLAVEAGLSDTADVERALDILCMDEEKQHASMLPFAPELQREGGNAEQSGKQRDRAE